jgi:hypothetical protein
MFTLRNAGDGESNLKVKSKVTHRSVDRFSQWKHLPYLLLKEHFAVTKKGNAHVGVV